MPILLEFSTAKSPLRISRKIEVTKSFLAKPTALSSTCAGGRTVPQSPWHRRSCFTKYSSSMTASTGLTFDMNLFIDCACGTGVPSGCRQSTMRGFSCSTLSSKKICWMLSSSSMSFPAVELSRLNCHQAQSSLMAADACSRLKSFNHVLKAGKPSIVRTPCCAKNSRPPRVSLSGFGFCFAQPSHGDPGGPFVQMSKPSTGPVASR
mmetsp:Transcript_56388/g.98511  ORF Transcript_56388/g.98511 Transcript_56388/m.98511 type:complete len:207 (+) Transcript_56388:166-786(+)